MKHPGLSPKSLRVLISMSRGYSDERILGCQGDVMREDIVPAAREALAIDRAMWAEADDPPFERVVEAWCQ